ncbi:MAG TPA: aldehyde dehydrogenase family protein [Pseudonocardia sp.]|nr:aldehyde dehydrogenase family protein [Pseudonocardia sp.]
MDVAAVAEGLFWTAFFNNGQACALVKRVYAARSIYADLVEALAEVARRVRVGDPTDGATQLGSLATRPQFERVSELVEHALAHGRPRCGERPVGAARVHRHPGAAPQPWRRRPSGRGLSPRP